MRTTVTLADDVAAAIEDVRRDRSIGVSEAINHLIRAGLVAPRNEAPFEQQTYAMGARMDLTNIGDVLDRLDGPHSR